MLPLLTLRERSDAPYAWTDADLRALAGMEPRGALWARVGRLGAGGLVGFARLPSGPVQVLPKAGPEDPDQAVANVLAMLARNGEIPRAPRIDELRAVRGDWIEALVVLFATALADALARGPLLRTRPICDDASPALRGRLRFAAAAAKPARAHLFSVEYFERRPDAPPMRALRWSVARLAPLARAPATRALLARLEADLAAVRLDENPPPSWFDPAGLTRHETRFVPPLALARLLRAGQTAALAPGAVGAASFWVDMDRLFERLAARLARRMAPPGWTVSAQDRAHYLGTVGGSGEFLLVPDLVLRGPEGAALVVDTKHKLWDRRPSHADAYAMATYLRRYHAPRGVLLYPRPAGERPVPWRLDLHDGARIEARFLDLTSDLSAPGAWANMENEMREALDVG